MDTLPFSIIVSAKLWELSEGDRERRREKEREEERTGERKRERDEGRERWRKGGIRLFLSGQAIQPELPVGSGWVCYNTSI